MQRRADPLQRSPHGAAGVHTGVGPVHSDPLLAAAWTRDAEPQGQTHPLLVQEGCDSQTFVATK